MKGMRDATGIELEKTTKNNILYCRIWKFEVKKALAKRDNGKAIRRNIKI